MSTRDALLLLCFTSLLFLIHPARAAPALDGRHGWTAADELQRRGFPITDAGLAAAMESDVKWGAMEAAFYHDVDIEEEVQAFVAGSWEGDGEMPGGVYFLGDLLALRYLAGRGDALSLQRLKDVAEMNGADYYHRIRAAEFVAGVSSDYGYASVLGNALVDSEEDAFAYVTYSLQEFPPATVENLGTWIDAVDAALARVAAESPGLEVGTRAGIEHLVDSALVFNEIPQPLYDKFLDLAATENEFVGLCLPPQILTDLSNRVPPP